MKGGGNVGVHQRTVLFQLVFAILIDLTNYKKGVLREIMYWDDYIFYDRDKK